ncbi:MAG: glycosyltransferase [bacterium]
MCVLNNKILLKSSRLVCFLPKPWYLFWAQGMLKAMAAHVPILLVAPPIDMLTSAIRPSRLINRLKRYQRLTQINPSLHLFEPFGLVSYGATYRFPIFAHINRTLLRRQVLKVLSELPAYKYLIVHSFIAQQYYAMGVLNPDLCIFDIPDEFYADLKDEEIDFKRPQTIRYRQFEKKMLDKADLVFVSSHGLYASRSKLHSRVMRIPVDCVDFELFSQARSNDLSVPDDIKAVPASRIGFVGNINELLDLELLIQLAIQRPQQSLVLVGAVNGQRAFKRCLQYQQLMKLPNVYHLGWRPYETLPSYIKAMDVCLMPYRLNAWMRNAHLNKTYQYLAAGKPVVSTAFPEVLRLDKVIAVARNATDFIKAVDASLKEMGTDKDIENRVAIGYENSSVARAKQRAKVIEEFILNSKSSLNKI